MGILTLTAAQKAASNIRVAGYNGYTQVVKSSTTGINNVWSNSLGTSPDEVLAALGTDAQKYYDMLEEGIAFIRTIESISGEPAAVLPPIPAATLSFNSDGSAQPIVYADSSSSASSESSGH